MNRSKLVFLCAVLLMLSAGVVVGRLSALLPKSTATIEVKPPTTQRSGRDAWISQLNLTSDQQQQMDAIWSTVKPKVEKTFEERRAAEKDRDDAIQKLLASSELRTAYDKIFDNYKASRTAIDKQRAQLIHDAEEKSRGLLNAEQQKNWDILSQQMHENRNSRHSSSQRSTTRRDDESGPS